MATVQLRQVIEFVLQNPKLYPGIHNAPNPRTSQGLPTLDPNRQMQLVWDGMCAYISEKLEAGKSVNIPKFGAFTFEPIVSQGGNMLNPRGNCLGLRPCFICSPELKETLYKFPGKEEVTPNPGSIYQQGMKMQYPNPTPIAAGTYYRPAVVDACIKTIFLGILDLSLRGYSMELDFPNFAKVRIMDRNLKVFFSRNFSGTVQHNVAAWPSRSMEEKGKSISSTWKTKELSNAMMTFHPRPDSRHLMRSKTRTLQLGIMSLDMTGCSIQPPGSLQASMSAPQL